MNRFQSNRRRQPAREERERRFAEALAAYDSGKLTLTQARIAAGLASPRAWLAYRFPRIFGHLCAFSAADRLRPVYAPEGGWRLEAADRADGRAALPPTPPRPRPAEAPEPEPPAGPSPPPPVGLHAR